MGRAARAKSGSGTYHVIVRGINRQNIFLDDSDRGVFLDRLSTYKKECGIKIYAYCLMSNHFHLLLAETEKPVSVFMKKLGTSYSYRFNRKYDRVGHVFQDRYKSEPVEDDAYFLTVFRYIHQNPQKAGLDAFIWTSYPDYAGRQTGIADTDRVKSLFASPSELTKFLNQEAEMDCMEAYEAERVTDEKAAMLIESFEGMKNYEQLQSQAVSERKEMLKGLIAARLSLRQIERLTGINRKAILREN